MENKEAPLSIVTDADKVAIHEATMSPPEKIAPAPQSPKEKLQKFFDNRPPPTELKQRNILKDSKVAPALQSAQAELERKKLEDELSARLSIRPNPEELVDKHILKPEEVPNTSPPQSPQEKLERFFQRRPSQHELEERNILKDAKLAPALHSAKAELEKARLEDDLSKKLAQRPGPEELIKERILEEDEDPRVEPKE